MTSLLAEVESVLAAGLPCALCTVVASRGSTPQKAGAMMLVHATGAQSGTLGGGCVEAEVKRRALQSLAAGDGPTIHTFTLNEDYGWDDGLICGGRMTILVDVLDAVAGEYFTTLRECKETGAAHAEIVPLSGNRIECVPGSRFLVVAGEVVSSRHADEINLGAILTAWREHGTRSSPRVSEDIAFLPTPPRIRLLIVGAGHVGHAVAKLAADLDFETWIVDDRASLITPERFPHASRRIAGSIGDSLKSLIPDITPNTYCLIVTRGHNHDEEALFHLAPTVAGYVGMIGSRRKVKLIFDDLRAKDISDEMLARVHAPVGLDIGSQTVNEIAVSIAAELIARRNHSSSPPS